MLGLEPRSLRSLGTSPLPRDFAPPRSPVVGLEPRSLRSLGTSPLPRDFAPPRSPVVGLEPRSLRSLGTSPLPRDFAPPRSPVVGRVQGPMRVRLSIVLAGVLVIAAAPSALAMTPEERTDPIPVAPRAIL